MGYENVIRPYCEGISVEEESFLMKVVCQARHGVHALHKPSIDLQFSDEIWGPHEKRVSLFEAQLKPLSHQESERLARHTLEDRPVPPGRIRHGGRIAPQRPVRTALAYSTSSVSMTPLRCGLISTRAALMNSSF